MAKVCMVLLSPIIAANAEKAVREHRPLKAAKLGFLTEWHRALGTRLPIIAWDKFDFPRGHPLHTKIKSWPYVQPLSPDPFLEKLFSGPALN
jgi:hypothetical protein